MNTLTIPQFIQDVEHEVRTLKKHATAEEINRLNLNIFNPEYEHTCIYGQMTGSCTTLRTKDLMDKACIRVMDCTGGGISSIIGNQLRWAFLLNVNGKYTGQTWDVYLEDGPRNWRYLSALEGYICTKDAKVAHIMDFLKDTTSSVQLNLQS